MVLLSTHIVSDIDYIADRILIMKNGKLIQEGTEKEITDKVEGCVWKCIVSEKEAGQITSSFIVSNMRSRGENVELRIVSKRQPVVGAENMESTLEDAYLYHTQITGKKKMRLYKTELFKLFHNKIFKIGILAVTGLILLYFWFAEVGAEIATVDGKFYSGYEAVQMNRKITEEFEGDLTDEKVNLIIEKYGLPTKLEENMPGWRDGNFLNDFVTEYFTNGTWERGVLPTEKYSLKETELGKIFMMKLGKHLIWHIQEDGKYLLKFFSLD